MNNAEWILTDADLRRNSSGKYVCDAYKRGIPKYVEEGEKDCPRFKPMPEE
jgi:hypothetical protein